MEQQETEAKEFDQVADDILDKAEKGTLGATSDAEQTEGEGTETDKTPGAEPVKTEQVKAVEDDPSLSVEDKIAKVKEILGDDEKAIDAYVKEKGYHNDPAWQKQREIIDRLKQESAAKVGLSDEDKQSLAEFKEVTSSSEYIQAKMKAQGFTQEAINKELKDKGFEVADKTQNTVDFIAEKLGVKTSDLKDDQKAMIEDVAKIFNVLMEDKLGKSLDSRLKPLEDKQGTLEQTNAASKLTETMRTTVKDEGILDFAKDIEPEIDKFLDENPDATQQDLFEHFKELNHKLSLERLKTGEKQKVRDEKKTNLRQNTKSKGTTVTMPAKTGDFDKDADAVFDQFGAQ